MQVVHAQTGHADALIPLFDQYRQTYGRSSDLALADGYIKARLAAQDSGFLLAIDGELATGFAHFFYSYTSVMAQRLLVLNDLFVAPQARRRGAANALLQALKEYAAESGCHGVKLETQTDNVAAKRLYEQAGYRHHLGTEVYFMSMEDRRPKPKRAWLRRWLGR